MTDTDDFDAQLGAARAEVLSSAEPMGHEFANDLSTTIRRLMGSGPYIVNVMPGWVRAVWHDNEGRPTGYCSMFVPEGYGRNGDVVLNNVGFGIGQLPKAGEWYLVYFGSDGKQWIKLMPKTGKRWLYYYANEDPGGMWRVQWPPLTDGPFDETRWENNEETAIDLERYFPWGPAQVGTGDQQRQEIVCYVGEQTDGEPGLFGVDGNGNSYGPGRQDMAGLDKWGMEIDPAPRRWTITDEFPQAINNFSPIMAGKSEHAIDVTSVHQVVGLTPPTVNPHGDTVQFQRVIEFVVHVPRPSQWVNWSSHCNDNVDMSYPLLPAAELTQAYMRFSIQTGEDTFEEVDLLQSSTWFSPRYLGFAPAFLGSAAGCWTFIDEHNQAENIAIWPAGRANYTTRDIHQYIGDDNLVHSDDSGPSLNGSPVDHFWVLCVNGSIHEVLMPSLPPGVMTTYSSDIVGFANALAGMPDSSTMLMYVGLGGNCHLQWYKRRGTDLTDDGDHLPWVEMPVTIPRMISTDARAAIATDDHGRLMYTDDFGVGWNPLPPLPLSGTSAFFVWEEPLAPGDA